MQTPTTRAPTLSVRKQLIAPRSGHLAHIPPYHLPNTCYLLVGINSYQGAKMQIPSLAVMRGWSSGDFKPRVPPRSSLSGLKSADIRRRGFSSV